MAHCFGCTGKLARNKSPKGLTSFHLRPPITFLVFILLLFKRSFSPSFSSPFLSSLSSPSLISPSPSTPTLSHPLFYSPPLPILLFWTSLFSPSLLSGPSSSVSHSLPMPYQSAARPSLKAQRPPQWSFPAYPTGKTFNEVSLYLHQRTSTGSRGTGRRCKAGKQRTVVNCIRLNDVEATASQKRCQSAVKLRPRRG